MALSIFFVQDLAPPWLPLIHLTDASHWGGAVLETAVSISLLREQNRFAEKNGWWVRLEPRENRVMIEDIDDLLGQTSAGVPPFLFFRARSGAAWATERALAIHQPSALTRTLPRRILLTYQLIDLLTEASSGRFGALDLGKSSSGRKYG